MEKRKVFFMDVSMLKVNQEAIIESIDGNGHLRLRLLEMGLLPNVHIKVIRKAPLGDPLEVLVRGYELSLRKEDATLIKVKVI